MDAEHVKQVVVPELRLEAHHRPEADRTGDDADHDGPERTGEAGCRRRRDKTRHGAGCGTEQAGMTTSEVLQYAPGQCRRSSRHDGVEYRDGRITVGLEVGAGVEAEPADPGEAMRRSG